MQALQVCWMYTLKLTDENFPNISLVKLNWMACISSERQTLLIYYLAYFLSLYNASLSIYIYMYSVVGSELVNEVVDVFVYFIWSFLSNKVSIFDHYNFLQEWHIFLKPTIVYVFFRPRGMVN